MIDRRAFGIPLGEAAAFFLKCKTAAVEDPSPEDLAAAEQEIGIKVANLVQAPPPIPADTKPMAGLAGGIAAPAPMPAPTKLAGVIDGQYLASMRFNQALKKLANPMVGGGSTGASPGMTPGGLPGGQGSGPEMSLGTNPTDLMAEQEAMGGPPPHGIDPDQEELQAYLEQEQQGQLAENAAAADYFNQRAQMSQEQIQQMQAQLEQVQQQTQELQAQVDQSQQAIQSAQQQAQMTQAAAMQNVQQANQMATEAMGQAMQQTQETMRAKQLAAAMHQGAQQMKDSVMGALAQDPTQQLAAQLQSPPPATQQPGMAVDPSTGQPMDPNAQAAAVDPTTGQPVQDPNAAAQQAAPAEGGGSEGGESKPKEEKKEDKPEKKEDKKEGTTVSVKTSASKVEAIKDALENAFMHQSVMDKALAHGAHGAGTGARIGAAITGAEMLGSAGLGLPAPISSTASAALRGMGVPPNAAILGAMAAPTAASSAAGGLHGLISGASSAMEHNQEVDRNRLLAALGVGGLGTAGLAASQMGGDKEASARFLKAATAMLGPQQVPAEDDKTGYDSPQGRGDGPSDQSETATPASKHTMKESKEASARFQKALEKVADLPKA